MILDLDRFIAESRPRWEQLQRLLDNLEGGRLEGDLETLEQCYRLYERACADLARLSTFAAAPEVQRYLDALVARAYAEIHETRHRPLRFAPFKLLLRRFPRAFRRHRRAFALAVLITLLGGAFGGVAVVADPEAKQVLLPFSHLLQDPSERVAAEEEGGERALEGMHAAFSAYLIRHNTRIGLLALGLGMTFGLGTMTILFYNGVILGAVCVDYVVAGESLFLAGWLLPHGVVEIPAILIAGQAGLVLARALLVGRARGGVRQQLREVGPDLTALAAGFAALLVWAGLVESFLSQTHQPVLPYAYKITLGLVELAVLVLFLARGGRGSGE